jgi:hypothetical protein
VGPFVVSGMWVLACCKRGGLDHPAALPSVCLTPTPKQCACPAHPIHWLHPLASHPFALPPSHPPTHPVCVQGVKEEDAPKVEALILETLEVRRV